MKRYASVISLLLFLSSLTVRLVSIFAGSSTVLSVVFYVLLVFGLAMLAIDSILQKKYAPAFVTENKFHLNIFAFIASAGFFVDFISDSLSIFYRVDSGDYRILVTFIPLCFACVFALLSSFYFVIIGLSFGGNYDFRSLRFFHIVPLVWSASKLFGMLSFVSTFNQEDASELKYIVLIFSATTFFAFGYEVGSNSGARQFTVFSIRALYFTGTLYFINELMLLLNGSKSFSIEDGMLSLTIMLLSGFMFFCEKNIIHHSKLEV